MPFAFSVGDFLELSQLASKIYSTCSTSQEATPRISDEFTDLVSELSALKKALSAVEPWCCAERVGSLLVDGIEHILLDCGTTLERPTTLLVYEQISRRTRLSATGIAGSVGSVFGWCQQGITGSVYHINGVVDHHDNNLKPAQQDVLMESLEKPRGVLDLWASWMRMVNELSACQKRNLGPRDKLSNISEGIVQRSSVHERQNQHRLMSCCSGKSNSFILWEEDDADVLEYVPCVETTVTVFYHTLLWKNFCGTRESVALAFAEQKTLAVNGVGAYGRARKLLKSSYESTIHEEVRGPLEFGARKKSHGLGSEGPSGAGMNAYAGRYGNPLIAAATQDFEAIVKLPLEHGAHVDAEGSSAFLTALSSSSYFWYHPVANMLRDQSAKPDLRRDNDDTACEGGHETTVDRPSLLSMPAIFPSLIPSDISCLVLYEGLKPYYEKWPMREGTDGGNNFWTPPNRKDPYLGDRAGASRFRWMGGRMIDITAGNLDKKYSSHGVATVFTQWRDTNHLLTVTIDAEHKNIAENEDVAGNKNIAEKEDVAEEYGSWKILVFDHIPLHVSQQTYCSSALGALLNLRRVHLTPKNSRSHFELSSARSALARLFCLVGRVLPVPLSRRFALLSPVLFAPSISAISVGEPANVQSSALSYDYWVQALRTMQTDLAALWTYPYKQQHIPTVSTSNPTTLLFACFICTSSLALITHARRKDIYQPYIIALGALIATVIGAMQTANVQVFVFGYLFWGCVIGAGGSAIFHHATIKNNKETNHEQDCSHHEIHRHEHQLRQAMDEKHGGDR